MNIYECSWCKSSMTEEDVIALLWLEGDTTKNSYFCKEHAKYVKAFIFSKEWRDEIDALVGIAAIHGSKLGKVPDV